MQAHLLESLSLPDLTGFQDWLFLWPSLGLMSSDRHFCCFSILYTLSLLIQISNVNNIWHQTSNLSYSLSKYPTIIFFIKNTLMFLSFRSEHCAKQSNLTSLMSTFVHCPQPNLPWFKQNLTVNEGKWEQYTNLNKSVTNQQASPRCTSFLLFYDCTKMTQAACPRSGKTELSGNPNR